MAKLKPTAEVWELEQRVVELEEQLVELRKRFEEFAARPVHDPFRPIGPQPGDPPWKGTHDRLKESSDEAIWPPLIRRLGHDSNERIN